MLNEIYDLFIDLDTEEEQINFHLHECQDGHGYYGHQGRRTKICAIVDAILEDDSSPQGRPSRFIQNPGGEPTELDYLGRLAIARVQSKNPVRARKIAIAKLDETLPQKPRSPNYFVLGLKRPLRISGAIA